MEAGLKKDNPPKTGAQKIVALPPNLPALPPQ